MMRARHLQKFESEISQSASESKEGRISYIMYDLFTDMGSHMGILIF